MIFTHDLPEKIVSDNGAHFTSAQLIEYCKSYAIENIRSPAYHSQSNGQAEKYVNTLKRVFPQNKRGNTKERINKTIPYHKQNKRLSKAQRIVFCRKWEELS